MMTRFEPFGEMLPLREAVNRLFEDSLVRPAAVAPRGAAVPMDVYTDGDDYVLELAVPGVDPNAVDISVLGNQVTLSGEFAKAPEGRQYLHRERGVGRFERTITLPTELDASKAAAHYEHGVLRLTLPKAETAKPRRISLSVNGSSNGNGHSA
jgi:HSP20 family protein